LKSDDEKNNKKLKEKNEYRCLCMQIEMKLINLFWKWISYRKLHQKSNLTQNYRIVVQNFAQKEINLQSA